jgi:hypothetical protein
VSYLENIENPSEKITTLVSIRPRLRLTGWVQHDTFTNTWFKAFDQRLIVGVYGSSFDSAEEEASISDCNSADYSWFYDSENEILYFNPNGSADPNVLITVVEWDWLIATESLNWFRNPADNTSGDAHWPGGLVKPAIPTQGNLDLLYGFSPVQVTTLEVQIADGENLKYLHDWSLNKSQVRVWQCAGPLETGNIQEVFRGAGGRNSMSGGVFRLEVRDPLYILDEEFEFKTFRAVDFPSLDPAKLNQPIPIIYGAAPFFEPVNIQYNETPGTSTNRQWVVSEGSVADSASLVLSVDPSGTNNGSVTTLISADGLYPGDAIVTLSQGDTVILTDNGTPHYVRVDQVDYSTRQILHGDIGSRNPQPTDTVTRSFVGNVIIFENDLPVGLRFGRDYNVTDFANGTRGFTLVNNFESNVSMSTFDPLNMPIEVRAYGDKTLPKKLNNTDDFGELSQKCGAMANPVTIIWDIFRKRIPKFDQIIDLDEEAWEDLATSFDRPVSLVLPKQGEFRVRWREVIIDLLKTELLYLSYEFSSLTITQKNLIKPTGKGLDDDELFSPEYSFDYEDVYSRVRVLLNLGEIESFHLFSAPLKIISRGGPGTADYLHIENRTFETESLFWIGADGINLADRLAFILSERSGRLTCQVPVGKISTDINDRVEVISNRLPGFELDGTINTRPYSVLQHTKSSRGVTLVLDDQKGIEDNSEDWDG